MTRNHYTKPVLCFYSVVATASMTRHEVHGYVSAIQLVGLLYRQSFLVGGLKLLVFPAISGQLARSKH